MSELPKITTNPPYARTENAGSYKAQAVLLEDMAAPLPVLRTVWNATEADARRTSKHFVDRSVFGSAQLTCP
jgi:hypothetical protein